MRVFHDRKVVFDVVRPQEVLWHSEYQMDAHGPIRITLA